MIKLIKKTGQYSAVLECTECANTYDVKSYYDAHRSRVGHLCNECKEGLENLSDITQEALAKHLNYDEITGDLTWSHDTKRFVSGELATHKYVNGYLGVAINKRTKLAHRVIWFMRTGEWPEQIDHIDHNRSNNAWKNLRNVCNTTNSKNCSVQHNSSTGYTGVRVLPSGRFNAYIMVNRKQICLGTYDVIEDAIAARAKADQEYEFHPNHGKEVTSNVVIN